MNLSQYQSMPSTSLLKVFVNQGAADRPVTLADLSPGDLFVFREVQAVNTDGTPQDTPDVYLVVGDAKQASRQAFNGGQRLVLIERGDGGARLSNYTVKVKGDEPVVVLHRAVQAV